MPGIWVVLGVVLMSGLLGGARNWLVSSHNLTLRHFCGRTIEAVIAAAAVPLFLSVIGREGLTKLFGKVDLGEADYGLSLCVFVGFALVAAVFSQRFLDGLSVKVMQLKEQMDDLESNLDRTTEIAEARVEPASGAPMEDSKNRTLSAEQQAVLDAFHRGHFQIRSIDGLIASAKLPRGTVQAALFELEALGLAKKLQTTKGERWSVTTANALVP